MLLLSNWQISWFSLDNDIKQYILVALSVVSDIQAGNHSLLFHWGAGDGYPPLHPSRACPIVAIPEAAGDSKVRINHNPISEEEKITIQLETHFAITVSKLCLPPTTVHTAVCMCQISNIGLSSTLPARLHAAHSNSRPLRQQLNHPLSAIHQTPPRFNSYSS